MNLRHGKPDESFRGRLRTAGGHRHHLPSDVELAVGPRRCRKSWSGILGRCQTSYRDARQVACTWRRRRPDQPNRRGALLHNLKHNKVIHRCIILMHMVTDNVPARRRGSTHPDRSPDGQLSFDGRPLRFHGSAGHPAAARCVRLSADAVQPDGGFIFRRPNDHRLGSASRWNRIGPGVLKAMHRNALPAIGFFRVPPDRAIELGWQVEI